MKHRYLLLKKACRAALLSTALLAINIASAVAADCSDAAQRYWISFRAAALKGDINAVAKATHFPFEVRGTLDDDKPKHLSRRQFIKAFPALLKSDPGLSETPSTMRLLLEKTHQLPATSCNAHENQVRLGSWVFQLENEGWRFARAFVEE